MLNYDTLIKHPKHFHNFTDLTIEEFNSLNQQITRQYNTYKQKRHQKTNHKRAIRTGQPFKLNLTNHPLTLQTLHTLHPTGLPS